MAGVFWANQDPYQLNNFYSGLTYSILLLSVISAHEFGHYFAARYHKVDVTLPYYIPFPFLFLNPFGTMGAVIKMKSRLHSRKTLFDIGIAGPIAGWAATMIILIYGYLTLPPVNFIYQIHPEYVNKGIPTTGFTFGYNIIFFVFEKIFSAPNVFVPPMNEIYHYPFLCVGWFGLLITSLNMMPVGQLDGGHISYTMFGENHKYIANIVFGLLVFFGLAGLLPLIGININFGSANWLVWAILIFFVIKRVHPPVVNDFSEPLGRFRTILGWISFIIFVISFCPIPILDN
ncbi:MAG: site-2 protease family protein [Ignavibacteriae bacterium]|nr:site-2 protease family protein [Ignavibacteriota bacterium]